jgi:hypothetical protein
MYLGGLAPGISAAGPTAASAAGALCPRSEVCWGGVVVDDFLGLTARNQCFLLGGCNQQIWFRYKNQICFSFLKAYNSIKCGFYMVVNGFRKVA